MLFKTASQLAAGRVEYRIEDLLRLECHPPPRFVGMGTFEEFVEGIEHVDLLARGVPRVILGNGEPLRSAMHVKIADIGDKLWLDQIVADIRSVEGQYEVIDPDATFLAADMAPLLMLGSKGAVEARRNAMIELHLGAELHRHRLGTPFSLKG